MGTKPNGSTFEEFEPFCSWKRGEGRDILEVHLPYFKKDQLKVQIKSTRTIMISGEGPLNDNKRSRFCKEVSIPGNANANEINAVFSGAKLVVTMPKIPLPSTQIQESTRTEGENKISNDNIKSNEVAVNEFKNVFSSGLGMSKKTTAAAAAGAAVGAYVAYKCCKS